MSFDINGEFTSNYPGYSRNLFFRWWRTILYGLDYAIFMQMLLNGGAIQW